MGLHEFASAFWADNNFCFLCKDFLPENVLQNKPGKNPTAFYFFNEVFLKYIFPVNFSLSRAISSEHILLPNTRVSIYVSLSFTVPLKYILLAEIICRQNLRKDLSFCYNLSASLEHFVLPLSFLKKGAIYNHNHNLLQRYIEIFISF